MTQDHSTPRIFACILSSGIQPAIDGSDTIVRPFPALRVTATENKSLVNLVLSLYMCDGPGTMRITIGLRKPDGSMVIPIQTDEFSCPDVEVFALHIRLSIRAYLDDPGRYWLLALRDGAPLAELPLYVSLDGESSLH